MNKGKIILIISSIIAISVGLFFAIRTILSPTPLSAEKSLSLYKEAVVSLDMRFKTYKVYQQKETVTNGTYITEGKQQTIQYYAFGTDDFTGTVIEETTVGDHKILSTEAFQNSTFYCTLGGDAFLGEMSQDAFLDRYAPFILIEPTLYSSVHGVKDDGEYMLYFADGITPEAWVNIAGDFQYSEGAVRLDGNGFIQECSYTCKFLINRIAVTLTVTTTPCPDDYGFSFFKELYNFKPISDPTAAKQLEIACAYLLSATRIKAEYQDEIYCQAFDDRRKQFITVSTDTGSTEVMTKINLENSGKLGAQSEIIKEETFHNGRYTISINNSEPTEDPQINAEKMWDFCQNILIGTVMLPEHISDVTANESTDTITYTFSGNESFSDLLRSDACEALYQDPEILTNQTQSYTTECANFYLELDIQTSLPISSGFLYKGVYTTDNLPYQLLFGADQIYHFD